MHNTTLLTRPQKEHRSSKKPFYANLLTGMLMLLYVASCGIPAAIDNTLAALDNAAAVLRANADEWRQTLEQLRETVRTDGTAAGQLVDEEVAIMLERAINAIDAGVVCNTDFLVDRLIIRLERLKLLIQGKEVQPIEPQLCLVVPFTIHSHRVEDAPLVEFFGFDFDAGVIEAFLEDDRGGATDVTTEIDIPTHYNMTLNLGTNGVQINDDSKRLVIYSSVVLPSNYDCNGNGRVDSADLDVLDQISTGTRDLLWCSMADVNNDGAVTGGELQAAFQEFNDGPIVLYRNELASITIIHAVEEIVTIPPVDDYTIWPVLVAGNNQFAEEGPEVWVDVELFTNSSNTTLNARVHMRAQQTNGGDSVAESTNEFLIYRAPQDWKIVNINNTTTDSLHYIDDDFDIDIFTRSGNGPVSKYSVYGNVFGEDIGVATRAIIEFNQISVTIEGIP